MAEDLHVVLFPWSAFGHIMPYFQLSIALAKLGVHVSFVSTPKILQRIPAVPPPLSSFFTLVPIPIPKLAAAAGDPLPEGAEATVDLPSHKVPQLQQALDLIEPAFRQFVDDHRPDWLIVDFSHTWLCDVSRDFQIPILHFPLLSPAFLSFMEHVFHNGLSLTPPEMEILTSPPPEIDGSTVACLPHEAEMFYVSYTCKYCGGLSFRDRMTKIYSASSAIAVRSCREFGAEYLNLFAKLIGKKVIPVGLLPPEKPEKTEYPADSPWKSSFEWLDKQSPRSVVFVGFGSECRLTRDQAHAIAHGLELSELPFLWALRMPEWAAAEEEKALPAGFRERTAERGIVSIGWAPQVEILAHPAIGGCLFHAGWGSAIEALQFGHCLVMLPLITDQPLNARLLEEKGLGVEVEKENDGSFCGEDIARALRKAMVSEKGEKLRREAREAAAIFGNTELHQRYVEDFVQFLKNGDSN